MYMVSGKTMCTVSTRSWVRIPLGPTFYMKSNWYLQSSTTISYDVSNVETPLFSSIFHHCSLISLELFFSRCQISFKRRWEITM